MNAVAATLAEIAGKMATLVFTIAAARALGPEGYGAFAYALSFSMLVATLPSWGFDLLLVQRGSADIRQLPRLLGEVLVWRTAIAIPVLAGAGIAGFALRPSTESAVTLVVVLAATVADLYSEPARAAATAMQDQVGISKALVLQRFAAAALAIGALVLGLGLIGLAVAYLIATLAGTLAAWRSVRRIGVRVDLAAVNRRGLARMGKLSIAIGIDTVISLALFRVDQVILSALRGDAALGPYAAAYRLVETVIFVAWAVAHAVFPIMSGAERWRIIRGFEQGMAAVAFFYVPFGVGLFLEAGPILDLLYGGPYAEAAATAARWLAVAPLLFAVAYLGGYVLLSLDKRWHIVTSSLAAAAVNVGMNLALIPSLGGTGAAIATVTSFAVEGTIEIIMLVPIIGLLKVHSGLVLPAIASAPMAALLMLLDQHVLVEVAIGGVVYAVLWFAMARLWAPEQLSLMRSILPGGGR